MKPTAALMALLVGCAGAPNVRTDEAPEPRPGRKGDPEPRIDFEPGPSVAQTAELSAWLDANRGRRLRLPVLFDREPGSRTMTAHVGGIELLVTDLALGVPLLERIAQRCGRETVHCALWLEGRYGETPHFPDSRPQFEILKVGDAVDEGRELRAARAK